MKKFLLVFLGLGMLLAGCQKPEDDPVVEKAAAPKLVSASPADGATDVSYEGLELTLTFDVLVQCPSDQRSRITVDNGASIDKIELFPRNIVLDISGLEPSVTYKVTFPKGTVVGYQENEAEAFSVSFTTKAEEKVEEPYTPSALDPVKSLVNPNATKEARNVYAFLLEQSGKKTLSGVQSSASNTNDMVNHIFDKTGKHPALAGYDFLFLHFSPTPDGWSWVQNYNDISAAKEQWKNNGLVNYMWHWNVPKSEADWRNGNIDGGYAFYTDETTFDINAALTEGTWQNEFIMQDIEEVAGVLKQLQEENIPVIWRPLHEAAGNYDLYGPNGAWFWWGRKGAEPCKKLWKLLYEQLVEVHGLDNLIWVWTVDVTKGAEDQYLDWYPGDEYVDILGVDIYEENTDAKNRQYQALVDLTKGRKLVTVSECGNIPDPKKCMAAGNKWSWFMVWPGDGWKLNTDAYWKQVMADPRTLTREAMPSLK